MDTATHDTEPYALERKRSQMWTASCVRRLLEERLRADHPVHAAAAVKVSWSEEGLRAHSVDASGRALGPEVEITEDRWWLPERTGRALVLASRLAVQLRQTGRRGPAVAR